MGPGLNPLSLDSDTDNPDERVSSLLTTNSVRFVGRVLIESTLYSLVRTQNHIHLRSETLYDATFKFMIKTDLLQNQEREHVLHVSGIVHNQV